MARKATKTAVAAAQTQEHRAILRRDWSLINTLVMQDGDTLVAPCILQVGETYQVLVRALEIDAPYTAVDAHTLQPLEVGDAEDG